MMVSFGCECKKFYIDNASKLISQTITSLIDDNFALQVEEV